MASGFRLWSAVLSAGVALSSRDWAASGATFAVMVAQLPAAAAGQNPGSVPTTSSRPWQRPRLRPRSSLWLWGLIWHSLCGCSAPKRERWQLPWDADLARVQEVVAAPSPAWRLLVSACPEPSAYRAAARLPCPGQQIRQQLLLHSPQLCCLCPHPSWSALLPAARPSLPGSWGRRPAGAGSRPWDPLPAPAAGPAWDLVLRCRPGPAGTAGAGLGLEQVLCTGGVCTHGCSCVLQWVNICLYFLYCSDSLKNEIKAAC